MVALKRSDHHNSTHYNASSEEAIPSFKMFDFTRCYENTSDPLPKMKYEALSGLLQCLLLELDTTRKLLFAAIIKPGTKGRFVWALADASTLNSESSAVFNIDGSVLLHNIRKEKRHEVMESEWGAVKEGMLFSNLDDTTAKYRADYIVLNSICMTKSALIMPISERSTGGENCLGIISISSTKVGFFNQKHLSRVRHFSQTINLLVKDFNEDLARYIKDDYKHGKAYTTPNMVERIPTHGGEYEVPFETKNIVQESLNLVHPVNEFIHQLDNEDQPLAAFHAISLLLIGLDENTRTNIITRIKSEYELSNDQKQEDEPAYFADLERTVENLIQEQKDRSRRPPKKFERIWQVFKRQRGKPVTADQLVEAGFSNRSLVKNALWDIEQYLHDKGYEILHIPSYQIRPKNQP